MRSELNDGTKRLLVFGGLVAAVVLIAVSIQQLAVVIVAAVVAAVVAILVHRSLGAADAAKTEPEAAEDPADVWIGHLQSLVALNIQAREAGLPEDVMAKVEENIDDLRQVIPELNDDHAGSELTWTVNRMATDYLPRIVTPYVALAAGVRDEHRPEFLRSLEGLEKELANIVDLLRNAKVGEFQAKAAFLRARFLDADLG
jgi:hypothetical protein